MDIRSFFAKKPAKKKKSSANTTAAGTRSVATVASGDPGESKSPPKDEQKNQLPPDKNESNNSDLDHKNSNQKKRKVIDAKSENESNDTGNGNGNNNNMNDDMIDNSAVDAVLGGSPSKKIRSSPPSTSTRAINTTHAKTVEATENKGSKNKKTKRRILDEDEDEDEDEDGFHDHKQINDDDDADDGKDDSYVFVDDSDDDFVELDEEEIKKSKKSDIGKKSRQKTDTTPKNKPRSLPKSPLAANKAKRARKSPSSTSTGTKKITILEPKTERDNFDIDNIKVSECMTGLTFVFTGNMDELNRDDANDLVKTLGGRVTTAVSGKTNYLVVGPVLEDGRSYKEGSKYRKATAGGDDKTKLVMGEKYLYGLCHAYHDMAVKEKGIDVDNSVTEKIVAEGKATTTSTPSTGTLNSHAKSAVSNPYAKSNSRVMNPYAKNKSGVSNPYAKSKKGTASNPYAKKSQTSTSNSAERNSTDDGSNSLWVDRHKPNHTREILGNKANVKKLQDWLRTWEKVFNNSKNSSKTFSNPRGPFKAALLSGPPGIGKTTTATLVAKEDGRHIVEFNASDVRSKKALQNAIGDLTGSQGISFANMKKCSDSTKKAKPYIQKRCIIMDEVDGMGGGDRGGISELIQMIKKSLTPIICICNDRQSQKIKSLLPYCMDLRYSRPTKGSLANRAVRIAEEEGLLVERNAAEAIAESCGNDVRQVINLLQMWAQKKEDVSGDDVDGGGSSSLTYKKLKDRGRSIQKDEMLRVNLFDAAKLIMEGPRDLAQADNKAKVSSLMKRNDAFFVDYSFTGLIVQQNYPKVIQSQYLRVKQKGDPDEEQRLIERLYQAAESMSDYDLADSQIRGGDLNWSLLPTAACLTVKTGYHAGGESGGFLGGFPEFSSWLGKNSTKGKNYRLLNELAYHMNYKVSANAQELRQTYIPVLRERIFKLLKNGDTDSNREVIAFMDEYGLSRDDIAENLDALVLGKKEFSFDDLDSKQKSAFTREYNAGVHKSQVLVREQGGEGKRKKRGKTASTDKEDEDEEEGVDSSDDEIDHEKEMEKLAAQFKKKGRKKKATKKATKKKK